MGQHISHCQSGTEPSRGDFEPHTMGEGRKRRLPGAAPKFLLNQDDHTALSRTTASTGQSSSKTSFSSNPSSPLGSSSGTMGKPHATLGNTSNNTNTNLTDLHHQVALRYTTSTRNLQLQNPATPEASATTATTAMPGLRSRGATDPATRSARLQQQKQQQKQQYARVQQGIRGIRHPNQPAGAGQQPDKRSNPVKFPRKRNLYGLQSADPRHESTSSRPHGPSPSHGIPPDSSYLERLYDSRTWEMYRRITSHREKVEAFNAANAAAKRDRDNDDRNSTNRTYMSDPVPRVTNSTTMEGGVDYDNFYDPAQEDDDDDSRGGGIFFLEDHSAPPCHRHRQCDNGQHHYTNSDYHHHNHHNNNSNNNSNNSNNNSNNSSNPNININHAETYSEWEHMNGDELEATGVPGNESTNAHGGQHETIFLFDF